MKVLSLVLVGIVAASGCSKLFGCRVTDSGKMTTKTIAAGPGKTLAPFTRVKNYGSFDVELKQGPQSDVQIEGDENIVKIVECKVQDGTLVIKSTQNYTTSTRLVVKVTIPAVEGLDVSGSGSISAADVSGDKLDIDVSGSGDVTVNGRIRALVAEINGSGEIDAVGLESEDAKVDIKGSGSAQVFANKGLDVDISGSGDIRYKGSAKVSKDINGSGSVEQM